VLPHYLERTQWVLAGRSIAKMRALAAAARAAGKGMKPQPGSICYMMSRRSYLNDTVAGPWYPHIMTFALGVEPAAWGANLTDSPIAADDTNYKPVTIFMVVVPAWSDGTVKRYGTTGSIGPDRNPVRRPAPWRLKRRHHRAPGPRVASADRHLRSGWPQSSSWCDVTMDTGSLAGKLSASASSSCL